MIVGNRRLRLLFLCLAAMDVAVFIPFYYLLWDAGGFWNAQVVQPALRTAPLFLLLWGALLLYMLVLEIGGRFSLSSRGYYARVAGLIVGSTLLGSRLLLHAGSGLSPGWLLQTVQAVYSVNEGIRPELALLLANLFLWQRAANASSRDTQFFGIGLSFRLGVLLLLLGGGLVTGFSDRYGDQVLPLLWIFFGFGLLAVSVARLEEKSQGASGSRGQILSGSHLIQLLLATAFTLAVALFLARYYTPSGIRWFLAQFGGLWRLLGQLAWSLLEIVAILLEPLFRALFGFLSWILSSVTASQEVAEFLDALGGRRPEVEAMETAARESPVWLAFLTRYGLTTLVILLAVGVVLLFLGRFQAQDQEQDAETVDAESVTFGGSAVRRGLERLRELGNLLNRYRLSEGLLAAISVQNMYANVGRLARHRGYGRRPAQAPDDYLPDLQTAFPHARDALIRLTNAYMRIHYGERSVDARELAQVRADYHLIRNPPPPTSTTDQTRSET